MKNRIGIMSLALLLCGCAQNLWYKPTAKQGEFEADRYACVQQSQQRLSTASVNRYGGNAIDQQITNDQVFSTCMTSKGWSLGRKEVVESQVAQQAVVHQSAKDRIAEIVSRAKVACTGSEYKAYYAKTGCFIGDITFAHLTDETKITEEQKAVLLKQQQMVAVFNNEQDEVMRSAGPNGQREAELRKSNLYPMNEKNNLNLYTGKITWGEYSQRRKDIAAEFQEYMKRNR